MFGLMLCTPGPERVKLRFAEEVLKAFCFLVKEYKFKVITIQSTVVIYESKKILITIYHGRSSYVLELEIKRKGNFPEAQEQGFTLGELIFLLSGDFNEAKQSSFQVSNAKGVKLFIPRLAELFKKYSQPILKGDLEIFNRLWEQRERDREKYAKEVHLSHIREKAEVSWHKKDYVKIVGLLEPVKKDLTSVELKKLEYAKKQSQSK